MKKLFFLVSAILCIHVACQRTGTMSSLTDSTAVGFLPPLIVRDTAVVNTDSNPDTLSIISDTVAVTGQGGSLVSPLYNSTLYADLQSRGVDYYAEDIIKGDRFEMDFEKEFRLTVPSGKSYVFPAVRGVRESDAGITLFKTVSGTLEMTVTIQQYECDEAKTLVRYPFKTMVSVRSGTEIETYSICGFYVFNPLLNDRWLLESINDVSIDRTKYVKEPPMIEFVLNGMRIIGYGGCNRLTGAYYAENGAIVFTQLGTTRMACPNSAQENDLLAKLSGRDYFYKIEYNRLTLTHLDGTALTFTK